MRRPRALHSRLLPALLAAALLLVAAAPAPGDGAASDVGTSDGSVVVTEGDLADGTVSGTDPTVGTDGVTSDPAPATVSPDGPLLDRPEPAAKALRRPGLDRARVVARNPHLAPAFVDRLLDDPTTWLDVDGRIFIVEAPHATDGHDHGDADETAAIDGPSSTLPTTIDPSQAFELESRPGALRTIYLDFDGHVASGTQWGSYFGTEPVNGTPFSTDGDGTTFTTSERNIIISVWRRVAEDFAPFAVNVTTRDLGTSAIRRDTSTDTTYGTRVVITSSSALQSSCGCGGVAYVGVFNLTGSSHDRYQPAWVFASGLGNSAKNIAEAATHEAGHNLGLGHDGTASTGYYSGHSPWAPIMGVGYNQPVSQWSKGEYSGANNTQDDLAIMQSYGLPLVSDDHGDTAATATALTGASPTATGVISTRTDVDVFSVVSAAGTLSLTVVPESVSPNLDIALTLRDGEGAVVATADPAVVRSSNDVATGLSATISTTVTAGVYTLTVDGVGIRTASDGYTDYGSLGRYRLTGTVPQSSTPIITTSSLPEGTVGLPYGESLAASGGTAPYAWSITSGSLPAGITLDAATGALSGMPSAAASSAVTFRVTDATSATAERTLTLTVVAPPLSVTTTSLPQASVGTPYSATLTATGGTGARTWSITSGSLPADIVLDSATGALSGVPTTGGVSTVTVRVTDAASATATATLTLTVVAPTSVSTSRLPAALVNTSYSRALAASGGTGPYTWAIASGSLPSGFSLSSGGTISGRTKNVTTASFTVRVTDATGQQATQALTLSVVRNVSVTTSSLPTAYDGIGYATTLVASGGSGTYDWDVSSGTLPSGLTLGTDGVLSGTPTQAGSFAITVRATDRVHLELSATRALTLTVQPAPTVMEVASGSVTLQAVFGSRGSTLTGRVRIVDTSNVGVGSVSVAGRFTGTGLNLSRTATTAADGWATLSATGVKRLTSGQEITFCVDSATRSGYALTTSVPVCVTVPLAAPAPIGRTVR